MKLQIDGTLNNYAPNSYLAKEVKGEKYKYKQPDDPSSSIVLQVETLAFILVICRSLYYLYTVSTVLAVSRVQHDNLSRHSVQQGFFSWLSGSDKTKFQKTTPMKKRCILHFSVILPFCKSWKLTTNLQICYWSN